MNNLFDQIDNLSKSSIADFVQELEMQLAEGEMDGSELMPKAAFLEALGKAVRASEVIKESYFDNMSPGDTYMGAKLEVNRKKNYTYTFEKKSELEKEKAKIDSEIKEWKKRQQTAALNGKPFEYLDTETGELVEVPTCRYTQDESPKITLPS